MCMGQKLRVWVDGRTLYNIDLHCRSSNRRPSEGGKWRYRWGDSSELWRFGSQEDRMVLSAQRLCGEADASDGRNTWRRRHRARHDWRLSGARVLLSCFQNSEQTAETTTSKTLAIPCLMCRPLCQAHLFAASLSTCADLARVYVISTECILGVCCLSIVVGVQFAAEKYGFVIIAPTSHDTRY